MEFQPEFFINSIFFSRYNLLPLFIFIEINEAVGKVRGADYISKKFINLYKKGIQSYLDLNFKRIRIDAPTQRDFPPTLINKVFLSYLRPFSG